MYRSFPHVALVAAALLTSAFSAPSLATAQSLPSAMLSGPSASNAVEAYYQRRGYQLNGNSMPFPVDGTFDPFRFFALPTPTSFHLGIAYDHFVAGGDSMVVKSMCMGSLLLNLNATDLSG